ncbi:MAG: bifunctional pyr operon transcriptional regulator/uracil phosphoribosyltransferase PyrR [Candidatus Theseobacter exili]|nr:bifunctional pyr operon transcriptional regulator/uracil phosphoribosyltransferase PyrR [Candidatus Theseobacter exili]
MTKRQEKIIRIMEPDQLRRVIMRISHEILEKTENHEDLAIVGIVTRGAHLARRVVDNIKEIEGINPPFGILDITLHRDDLDISGTREMHKTEINFDLNEKNIVLVDDVLFSGRTVRAALDEITDYGRPKKIQLAVLIDRGHRELPIRADCVGKNIPTSFDEKVRVHLKEEDGEDVVLLVKQED